VSFNKEKKTEDIKTDIDVSKKDDDFTKTEIADDVSENPFSEEVSESKEGRTATAPIDRPDGNNLVEAQPKQKGEPETEPTIIPIASDSVSNILKATNSSKNCQPSANSFKNDIIKLSKSFKNVRDILPLFTNLGVLSREQIYKISICVDFCDESDFERANVDASINELARKGLLASFKYEDDDIKDDVFCLSPYCYGCLSKQSIAQKMKGFWGVSFGEVKVVSAGEIDGKLVSKYVRSNKRLADYLYISKGLVESDGYKKIKKSIKWYDDYLRIAVAEDGECYQCCIYDPKYYVEDIDESGVLVVGKDEFDEDELFVDKVKIFVCDNQGIRAIENPSLRRLEVKTGKENPDESVLEDDVEVKQESEIEKEEGTTEKINQVYEGNTLSKKDSGDTMENKKDIIKSLIEKTDMPTDKEFCDVIYQLLNRDGTMKDQLLSIVTQTVVFAKAVGDVSNLKNFSSRYTESHKLSAQIRLATHLMLNEYAYTSECLTSAFVDPFVEDPALMLSAYLFAMLVPGIPYDYNLKSQVEQFFSQYEDFFGRFDVFKPLFNTLMGVSSVAPTGFSPAFVSLLGDDAEKNEFINELRNSAREFLTFKGTKSQARHPYRRIRKNTK